METKKTIIPLDNDALTEISIILKNNLTILSQDKQLFSFLNTSTKNEILDKIKSNINYLETGVKDLQILIQMLIDHEIKSHFKNNDADSIDNKEGFDHTIKLDLDFRIMSMNKVASYFFGLNNKTSDKINIKQINNDFALDINLDYIETELARHDQLSSYTSIKTLEQNWVDIKSKWTLHRDTKGLANYYTYIFTLLDNPLIYKNKENSNETAEYRAGFHDFRSTMASLSSGLEMIKSINKNKNIDELIIILKSSLIRGDNIIEMLQENDYQKNILSDIYLPEIIEELTRTLSKTNPKISFKTILKNEIPTNKANETQTYQMINNLCKNGIEAMPEGGKITLTLETIKIDKKTKSKLALKKDEYLKLDIIDSGYGISENDLNLIFDPYYSTKHSTTAQGIGLANVKFNIEKINGAIHVKSVKNKGTTMSLYFPMIDDYNHVL